MDQKWTKNGPKIGQFQAYFRQKMHFLLIYNILQKGQKRAKKGPKKIQNWVNLNHRT